ncbi:hypothetical protein COU96_02100 [Candidatus Shapirobacteria bacterium CG10_big_fil_rev_8_21_14_0_10_38_14]|uniref:Uncharacterized protein n=1 Tax=Candidatus Shapirobacteria bacterium CG10_big_fil_rev_8_21_14_0_10_38_14 TaxID=1974483 RepID=A0A2M8L5A1_9BACT|nr:MAG: hypothetical protein COU96_02100 [Candidatus Shapirobacteria bacterium CG10_big_fil_rev_8_21_14_0_10_38_14]
MKIANLEKVKKLYFFTKEALRQIEPDEQRLNFNLKYWLGKGKIISLKKGLYILKEKWEKEENKQGYLEYLANKLYEPSYVSGEYVMDKYSLLTEAVYRITNITTKSTKSFANQLGAFSYYSITPKLFVGWEIKKFYSAPVLLAKKSKGLFDFLYLRFLKETPINEKMIKELRINWENISSKEFKEIQKYARLSGSRRINLAVRLIKKIYYA